MVGVVVVVEVGVEVEVVVGVEVVVEVGVVVVVEVGVVGEVGVGVEVEVKVVVVKNTKEPNIKIVGNFYIIDGKRYVRMTRAMKTAPTFWLEQWIAKVGVEKAKEYAEATAELGTLIHLATELYDLKERKRLVELVRGHDWLTPYVIGWGVYVDTYIDEIMWIERVVWSDELRAGGRIDRLVRFKRATSASILDIKSTETLHDDMGVQVCGYKKMAKDTIIREGLDKALIPQRTVIAHLPGPRQTPEGVERIIFDKVKVKEYDAEKYEERMMECVSDFWYLTE